MRLTLRTLLAYLDDVLDPADKEELGKKIESSEFAEDLVHRTRDTMRRLRLSAPQVVGAGMGLDPNTVAEYLDNALPPDSMGDFERICLESDMHLAEVASCHHVLTMVLGQPADVDPAAKQRMYSIPTEAAERKRLRVEAAHSHVAADAATMIPASSLATAPVYAPSKAVEIPEYLRTTGWSRYRGLMIGLAALLLVAATLYFLGGINQWFDGPTNTALRHDTVAVDVPPPNTTAPSATVPEKIAGSSMHQAPAFPATPEITPPPASPPALDDATTAVATTEPATGVSAAGDPSSESLASEPVGVDGASGTSSELKQELPVEVAETPSPYEVRPTPEAPPYAPTPDAPLVPAPATTSEIATSTGELPGDTTATVGDRSATSTGAPILPGDPAVADPEAVMEVAPDGTVTIGELNTVDGGAGAGPEVGAADLEPDAPKVTELGTYLGGKTVLLRYDEAKGGWFRVTPRSAIAVAEKLLALPEFRPKITLIAGLHLDMAGDTLVTMGTAGGGDLSAVAADVPAIDVIYGRIVLINTSNDERQVRLTLGPTIGDARLARNATLAVEVERKYVPGLDPRKAAAPVIARLYVPEGVVVWQDGSGEQTIDKPSEWTIADGAATEIVDSKLLPEWIDQETATVTSEQRPTSDRWDGSGEIESALVSDRPVEVQLLELFQGSRRREVKSLAARCGMHVGRFEPFVEALRDSQQKSNWPTHIESLRSAMALGPESAEKIWRTLVEQRGETAAADLYEMLCGYNPDQVGRTPDQWKTGAIARLIEWLDQESLDYRVLAVHDLREITGKQFMTNPAGNLDSRARSIRIWRSRLGSGELKPAGDE